MSAEIIRDLPIGEYHALERLSNSAIGSLQKSPAHFRAKDWSKPSKAMRIGSGVHTLVLEPHLASVLLPVAPVVNKRTKAGKEEWAAWEAGLAQDAVRLAADERAIAHRAALAILNNLRTIRKLHRYINRNFYVWKSRCVIEVQPRCNHVRW